MQADMSRPDKHIAPPEGADDAGEFAVATGKVGGTGNPDDYKKDGRLKSTVYDVEMERLQEQLVLLQYWIQKQGLKVVVIFEGRGSAGKGGVIKRITERTSPRTVRVAALPTPTERQKSQWYFQRYVEHLPAAGEMVLFDRSWYNRSNVEWVMGFCTEDEHAEFLRSCPEFERMLVRSGIIVIKYWFSVSYDEQRRRFEARNAEPLKRWKLSDHGPRRARVLREVLHGQGQHLPVHRHQAGSLVRRALRRQEGRPPQLHQPPAEPVRV
jgi:polyphosphate kinase 2